MKKIIINEQQIKKIIHTTINEQVEKEEKAKAIKSIQCFLNKILNTNYNVDGWLGNDTENLIKRLQKLKGINIDGKWGPNTYSSLTNKEKVLFRNCVIENGSFLDKINSVFSNLKYYLTPDDEIENKKSIMAYQCFLNKTYNANLVVDGIMGQNTKKLSQRFDNDRKGQVLSEKQKQLLRTCIGETGGIVDKIMSKIINFFSLD